MASFSQRLQILVGLMSLATRAGLAAEDRLGLWSSALTDSLWVQTKLCLVLAATQSCTQVGLAQLWGRCGQSGACGTGSWLSVPVTAAALCPLAGQSRCQVRPGCRRGDRTGPQTAHISHPERCFRSWLVAAGSPLGWEAFKHQPPCSRSAETPSSGVTHHPCHRAGHLTSAREGLCWAVGDEGFGDVVEWPRSQLFEGKRGGRGGRSFDLLSLPGDSRPSSGGRCR